jgi:ketosteroid isomerase-like protein
MSRSQAGSPQAAVVEAFIGAVNRHDLAGLSSLMAPDHSFVDPAGRAHAGRERMIEGWRDYFRMFPDYRVTAERILSDGPLVAVFGSATGTYNGRRGLVAENTISMPAAWKAVVEDGLVRSWQVYADWTEGMKTIERDRDSA